MPRGITQELLPYKYRGLGVTQNVLYLTLKSLLFLNPKTNLPENLYNFIGSSNKWGFQYIVFVYIVAPFEDTLEIYNSKIVENLALAFRRS